MPIVTCAFALCAGATKIPAAIAIKASVLNVFIYLPFTNARQLKRLPEQLHFSFQSLMSWSFEMTA